MPAEVETQAGDSCFAESGSQAREEAALLAGDAAVDQPRRCGPWALKAREDDYLRFARDLRIPFTNNLAEQVIRMSKLRIKVSGCMRSMKGAESFCAIRSYLATAARHGITWVDALTRTAEGKPLDPRHHLMLIQRPEPTPSPVRRHGGHRRSR
jgi:hypothetical protein